MVSGWLTRKSLGYLTSLWPQRPEWIDGGFQQFPMWLLGNTNKVVNHMWRTRRSWSVTVRKW